MHLVLVQHNHSLETAYLSYEYIFSVGKNSPFMKLLLLI